MHVGAVFNKCSTVYIQINLSIHKYSMYVCTYVGTYYSIHTYVVHTYVHIASIHTYVRTYIRT